MDGISVEDLKYMAVPYLNEKAKQALSKTGKTLSILRADAEGRGYVYAQCLYVGIRTKVRDLKEAVKFVAEKINALADEDQIVSTLSHFTKVDLYTQVTSEPECVVVCYVHVLNSKYEEIMGSNDLMEQYGAFQEGECP